jgi:putative transposase
MPNHFHLLVWPHNDGDLSRWMQGLLTSHVRRDHRQYGTSGHVWQGRFKAFPVQEDEHYRTVLRYIERNPLRAGLVQRSQAWEWSSLRPNVPSAPPGLLTAGPLPKGRGWSRWVNGVEAERELEALRPSVNRGTPFGKPDWQQHTAQNLGLQASLNPRGRPRKA